MKVNSLVSIIVPIYNVEKYLPECIESILNQTYSNFELILINDKSPDNCKKICNEYAKIDRRIKVIHQEKNGGVSSARNTGLEIARGKWIVFIDPDDWIEHNTLEISLKIAEDNNVDILGWNCYLNYDNKQVKVKEIYPKILIRKDDEIRWFILDTMYPEYDENINKISVTNTRSSCSKLFSRNIIFDNNIRFSTDLKLGEDSFFCIQCYEKSGKIILINEYFSHYRVVKNSANRKYCEDLDRQYEVMLNKFYSHIEKRIILEEEFLICYTGLVCRCIGEILRKKYLNYQNPNSVFTNIKEIKKLLNKSYLKSFNSLNDYSHFGFQQKIVIFLTKRKCAAILYLLQIIRNFIKSLR